MSKTRLETRLKNNKVIPQILKGMSDEWKTTKQIIQVTNPKKAGISHEAYTLDLLELLGVIESREEKHQWVFKLCTPPADSLGIGLLKHLKRVQPIQELLKTEPILTQVEPQKKEYTSAELAGMWMQKPDYATIMRALGLYKVRYGPTADNPTPYDSGREGDFLILRKAGNELIRFKITKHDSLRYVDPTTLKPKPKLKLVKY